MKEAQLHELLYQALETELGGVEIYTTAVRCAINEDLKEEWEKYLEQTQNHVQVVQDLIEELGLDPDTQTPGRQVVHHIGSSLVQAMEKGLSSGNPDKHERFGNSSVKAGRRKKASLSIRSTEQACMRPPR